MTYVLYDTKEETKEEGFFFNIAGVFCKNAVKFIGRLYNKYRDNFVRSGNSLIDETDTMKFIGENEKILRILYPLSCSMLGIKVPCVNQTCEEGFKEGSNRAVLASDQIEIFSRSMTNKMIKFEEKEFKEKADRQNFQRILQHYHTINMQKVEIITISIKNAETFHKLYPQKYRDLYVKGTNKLKGKDNVFIYVRAGAATESDFDEFMNHTELSGVMPCDALYSLADH